MVTIRRLLAYARLMGRARRHRADMARWFARRPALLTGIVAYEAGQLFSNRVDPGLKALAMTKVSALVGCPFCMDMGSAVCASAGVSEEKLRALPHYRHADVFTHLEKLALDLAVAMTATPSTVTDDLRDELLRHLTKAQLAELANAIATENLWSRQNRALGIRPVGFSDDTFCVLPEPPPLSRDEITSETDAISSPVR
jgi:alkylhydroperoxidase family enzyme